MTPDILANRLMDQFSEYLKGIKAVSRKGYDYAFVIQNTDLSRLYRVQDLKKKNDEIEKIQKRISEFMDHYNLKWGYGSQYEYLLCWYR